MKAENLFEGIPAELSAELFTAIHRSLGLRIERIVSQGQSSPEGFWYDQDEHEWVVVLEGRAVVTSREKRKQPSFSEART